VGFRTLRR